MKTRTRIIKVNPVKDFLEALNAYFQTAGSKSVAAVAAEVEITRQHLYEIRKGASMPSMELAVKITEAIGGKVTFDFSEMACNV